MRGSTLRIPRLYLKVAIFQPELQEYGPRATLRFSSRSCGGVLRVLRLYLKLRFSSLSCGSTLRILRLYLKVAIFQPELQEHAPRTTFVLKSCDFQAGAAADQGGIEPATAGLRKQARKQRDNFQRPFREQEHCRERFDTHNLRRGFAETKTNSSESASTRTIPAEGRARTTEIVTSPQFFEPRTRESPQRVARAC